MGSWPLKLPSDRGLDSLKVGSVVVVSENDRWLPLLPRFPLWYAGARGDDPARSITAGERASVTYGGPGGSRVDDLRGADEDEGHCRWCLLAGLEVPDMDEAMESLLLAPRRCGARGTPPKPGPSPEAPMMFPISVEVRNMDMTPGADARDSCLSAPPWPL